MSQKRIAAYCRVSTDKTDQLNSLETQKRFFTEYADRKGYNLVRLYADEGISGTKTKNRLEFLQLMKDAKKGMFEVLVVKDISRMARNTLDFLQSIRTLKEQGIETIFLTANMTSMGDSEFVLTLFAALAQEESANTSKRIKFSKKMNAEHGKVPNIVYGYDKIIGDFFHLSINSTEAEVVKRIYNMYLNEGYGASKIANQLNEEGIRTKRNYKWSQNAICRILTNQLYTGKIINGKQEVKDFLSGVREEKEESEWIIVERPELRIIDQDVFDQVQKVMESRYNAFRLDKRRQNSKHLFSTIICCKECGYSFQRRTRTYKNTYVKWICSNRYGKGIDNCENEISIDEDELIDVLEDYFADILRNKDNMIHNIVESFNRVYQTQDNNMECEKQLQKELESLKKKKEKYMDIYEDNLITKEDFKERITPIQTQINKVEKKLNLVENKMKMGDQLEAFIQKSFENIECITSVRDLTNAQLKQIIQKIEVDKEGNVDIYLHLLKDLGLDNNVLVYNNCT